MVTTRRSAASASSPSPNPTDAAEMAGTSAPAPSSAPTTAARSSPYLPTRLETMGLALFPAILVFGSIFSMLSPQTRDAPYDPVAQAHVQDPSVAPSYFARKSNLFNVLFVKQGWAWATAAVLAFSLGHPAARPRGLRAFARLLAVTAWWFLVTQWCFGAPIIDRGFRWSGGQCEMAERDVAEGDGTLGELVTAVACKTAGGRWKGGHDISGHVFLLVLSSTMILEEMGWTVLRWSGRLPEERAVVMADGAVKGAGVESDAPVGNGRGKAWLGLGGQFATAVVSLNLWMLLMTAIYFHTWFEKFTGLLTALLGFYAVYIVPRFVPTMRGVLGMPGI